MGRYDNLLVIGLHGLLVVPMQTYVVRAWTRASTPHAKSNIPASSLSDNGKNSLNLIILWKIGFRITPLTE